MEGPLFPFFFFLRKRKTMKKKVRRLKEKTHCYFGAVGTWAPWTCPVWPSGCTYPPYPARWATGVTGSWGASSLHSEASSAPPAGPAVNGSLVAVTGTDVQDGGPSSPLALLLWGKVAQMGQAASAPWLPSSAG